MAQQRTIDHEVPWRQAARGRTVSAAFATPKRFCDKLLRTAVPRGTISRAALLGAQDPLGRRAVMVGAGRAAIGVAMMLPFAAAAYGTTEARRSGDEQRVAQMTRACTEISERDVEVVPHGFIISSRNAFVPQDEAKVSPDDRYWICTTGERGFFVPADRY